MYVEACAIYDVHLNDYQTKGRWCYFYKEKQSNDAPILWSVLFRDWSLKITKSPFKITHGHLKTKSLLLRRNESPTVTKAILLTKYAMICEDILASDDQNVLPQT